MSRTQIAFAALLALVALARLVEVVVSVRRARRRAAHVIAEPWLFPVMVLLHVASLTAPLAEVVLLDRPFLPALATAAGALLLVATALRVWTLRTIGQAWNVRVVVPDDDQVVTSGPYAWIRHPNYLVVCLELLALPLLHTAWISALGLTALNALVLAHRIPTEEAALSQREAWSSAMASRARLLPGLL